MRPGWRRVLRDAALLSRAGACLAATAACSGAALPDKADAAARLDQFRRSIYAESIYIEFDLRQMPRRGDEHVFRGRLWGARNERGPITRFEVDAGRGGPVHRILVQGGPDGALWVSDGPGKASRDETALLRPLVPGVEITPFDLQMPYLYWLDSGLAGEERIRGRSAYAYVFTPPAEFTAGNPDIKSVRAYLDTEYDALMQSEITGANGRVAKTLSLLELRKVGDRWIPRDLDVRNEATRDKTRLSVTGVAIGITADPSTFDPSLLGVAASPPPAASVTPVTQ
jgi:hypothetical protein